MHEAGIGTNELGQMCEERDDVMLGFALDFINAVNVEGGRAAFFPNGLGCGFAE